MNYGYYKTLIGEYISLGRSEERLLGEIGFPSEIKWDSDGLTRAIRIISAAADNNIKQLIELSGLSMASFARKFELPYRSVQNWCTELDNKRTPPEYLPILIGYVLISEIEERDDGDI